MLGREEDADVEIPTVDRSNPHSLLDVRGWLALPSVVDPESCEPRRPSGGGGKAFASASDSVHPDEDSAARELLEAPKESNRMCGGSVRGGNRDNE